MSSSAEQPTSERVAELRRSLDEVRLKVQQAVNRVTPPDTATSPCLVAVSKLKSAEDIQACYDHGQRDFGENYAAELVEKAKALPKNIRWHFIGGLQTNKCKVLAAIPNLYAVQTVDNSKQAAALNRSLPSTRTEPLRIYVQVNTSEEDQKSGVPPLTGETSSPSGPLLDLAKFIIQECPRLRMVGLMTIGSFSTSVSSDTDNPDFQKLKETRGLLESVLRDDKALDESWRSDARLQLSMGMSSDFEVAIGLGSDTVRVGTSIFGARPPK